MNKGINTKRAALAACGGGLYVAAMGVLLYLEGKQAGKRELVELAQKEFMATSAVHAEQPEEPSPVSANGNGPDLPAEPTAEAVEESPTPVEED